MEHCGGESGAKRPWNEGGSEAMLVEAYHALVKGGRLDLD